MHGCGTGKPDSSLRGHFDESRGAAAGGAARGKMEGLQDQLEAFIEHLRVVGVIAGDF